MRIPGLFLCTLLLAIPLVHFAPLLATKSVLAVASQYLGFFALIAMAQIMVLATRLPGVELLYGGLDRVYVLHKWLGITALTAVLLHETMDAEIKGLEFGTRFDDLAEDIGELGYNGLLALIAITLMTFIPYHWWRVSHKFMGVVFAMAAFHAWFIEKSFSNSSPMGLYILALSGIGVLAYIYTLVPARWMQRMHSFQVTRVEDAGDAVSVTLTPQDKGISHRAGQFAFIGLENAAHSETHPFTISSAPGPDSSLRFTVKPLGEGTMQLVDAVKVGQKAQVSQAFGHFRFSRPGKPQVWIAGGIGITPFLAWAGQLPCVHAPVDLFICCKSAGDVAHLDELRRRASTDKNFNIHMCESRSGHRISAGFVQDHVPDLSKAIVSFCGSEALRDVLRENLASLGVKRRNFHYEEFKIRSGLPLAPLWTAVGVLLAWLRRRPITGMQ